jgi:hypothetical protein
LQRPPEVSRWASATCRSVVTGLCCKEGQQSCGVAGVAAQSGGEALLRLVSPRHGELGDSRLALDHQRELVKRDRHAPGHRRLDRQLVMPSTNVLDQGEAGDHDPGAASCLSPRIGRSRAFSLPWSASTRLLAYCSVLCHAAGSNSSNRQQLFQDDRVGRRLIGHDLARHGPRRADSPLEESTGRPQIAPWRDEHVDARTDRLHGRRSASGQPLSHRFRLPASGPRPGAGRAWPPRPAAV